VEKADHPGPARSRKFHGQITKMLRKLKCLNFFTRFYRLNCIEIYLIHVFIISSPTNNMVIVLINGNLFKKKKKMLFNFTYFKKEVRFMAYLSWASNIKLTLKTIYFSLEGFAQ
jgi:hypothetical protein